MKHVKKSRNGKVHVYATCPDCGWKNSKAEVKCPNPECGRCLIEGSTKRMGRDNNGHKNPRPSVTRRGSRH